MDEANYYPDVQFWFALNDYSLLMLPSMIAALLCSKVHFILSDLNERIHHTPGTLTTRSQRRSTFFYITYINSVRTSQEAQYISVV
jgi:hypothetical protein